MAPRRTPKSTLDALMKSKGITLAALSVMVDLDIATISRHRNRRQKISRESAHRYSQVFAVNADLLTGS